MDSRQAFQMMLMETGRSDALSLGHKRYFTGKRCSAGHVSWRWTSSTQCYQCTVDARPEPKPRVKLPGTHYSRNRDRIIANYKPASPERRARMNELAVARYWNDPEAHREKNRQKHAAKKEKRNAVSRAQYYANKERRAETRKAWFEANPGKTVEYSQKRRSRILAGRNDLTAKQVREVTELQKGRCANCKAKPKRLTVDHIIALSKGGENTRRNIQMLCKTCNCKKNALDPIEFARRQGKLV